MSVDLLRQQPRWKEALVSLRETMTSLVQQVSGFSDHELERFVANVIRSKMSFIDSGQIELPLYKYSVAAISCQRQTLFVHVVVRFPYYFYHSVTLIAL